MILPYLNHIWLIMEKKIKLIWDFRGPESVQTARHFEQHLRESPLYRAELESGTESLNGMHSIAFLIVPDGEMPHFRDRLKPHRGALLSNPGA